MLAWVMRWWSAWRKKGHQAQLDKAVSEASGAPVLGVDSGSGNVQVGSAAGQVVVHQVTYHVQTMHMGAHPPAANQACAPFLETVAGPSLDKPRAVVTHEQRTVLQLMKRTGCEGVVLNWMEREMHTRRVVELQPRQLYRLKRYCETIIERAEQKRLLDMGC